MKKLLFILGASMFLFACTQVQTETTTDEVETTDTTDTVTVDTVETAE